MTKKVESIKRISVIVPESPFSPAGLKGQKQYLCALNVEKLMHWWPGTPHSPHRDPVKVKNIQRSLDWKRVAQIAAYLLQEEILDAGTKINKYFKEIYESKKDEKGREWPPRINKVIGYEKSGYPIFSNVLIHVNGARIEKGSAKSFGKSKNSAWLVFDEHNKDLNFCVIDGQHRINGAYFALMLRKERDTSAKLEIPAQIFLDLDLKDQPPKNQAQIFIDVNYYQKKVDRSLVADLFPTTREGRDSLDNIERAQDIGRRLMLETGPLVGMIQIPGIKYGIKDVVTLATLNSAIEKALPCLNYNGLDSLGAQTQFIADCLSYWLEATGRSEPVEKLKTKTLNPESVVYQGRVLISVIDLMPAIFWKLQTEKVSIGSEKAKKTLLCWFKDMINKANLVDEGMFVKKSKYKDKGFLGSGGIGRFKDTLWASIIGDVYLKEMKPEKITLKAIKNKEYVNSILIKEKKK